MTLKYEITKQYTKKQIIRVCMFSYEKMKKGEIETLEHLIGDDVVIMKPKIKNYDRYTHGICDNCLEIYYSLTRAMKLEYRNNNKKIIF